MTPSIVFRTDASKSIGFGHLRRCLTLAQELRRIAPDGAPSHFLVGHDPAAAAMAAAEGFPATVIAGAEPAATLTRLAAAPTHVLVVDSYQIGEDAFGPWGRQVDRVVVIDDLADRRLDVDAVLNVSSHAGTLQYRTGPGCLMWLGPQYALLRPPFRDLPPRKVADNAARILVTLGGADPQGSTVPVVAAVLGGVPGAVIDVVVGPLFGAARGISALAAAHPTRVHLHQGVDDLTPLMARADFAVSGGGQTLFELAASGLPTIALELAPNQGPNIRGLDGVTLLAAGAPPRGADDAGAAELAAACRRLALDTALRANLSRAGQRLVDGHGASRVARLLLALVAPAGQAPENPP